jgi:hypothetical protein
MSKITVKGYVNKPSTKAGSKGSFAVFTVAEQQKNRDGSKTKNYFNVTNFNSPTPPEESAFVEVTGYLNFRTYGEGKVSYDINAQEVAVVGSSSDSKASAGTEGVQEKDPWE